MVEPIAIALEQERKVTDQISELTSIAREEGDFVSEQFMQWFLKEQVEEIDLMSTLLHTAERSRDRPLDIEDFIAREGIGGAEEADRLGASGRRWLISSCSRWPPVARRWTRWRSGWPASCPRLGARSTWPCTTCACRARPGTSWRARSGTPRPAGWPFASPTTRMHGRTRSRRRRAPSRS